VEIKSGMDKLLKRNVTVQVMLPVADLAAASSVLVSFFHTELNPRTP
jgi:hypothetical protein